jgi:hypothetical protein
MPTPGSRRCDRYSKTAKQGSGLPMFGSARPRRCLSGKPAGSRGDLVVGGSRGAGAERRGLGRSGEGLHFRPVVVRRLREAERCRATGRNGKEQDR